MTVDRFKQIIPLEHILIVTNAKYKSLVLEQIAGMREEQVLCEPARRNTAPCIAYAMYHITAEDANIIVAPSDHLILKEDLFLDKVKKGLTFTANNKSLLTIGITPSRPETGYGYIKMQQKNDIEEFVPVAQFTEKPNHTLAEAFLASGDYLWNSGIFMWSKSTILDEMRTNLPDLINIFEQGKAFFGTPQETEWIQQHFELCPNISIDYGVMEKARSVYVMPADFGWSDLGTWGSIYTLAEKDNMGNATLKGASRVYDCAGNLFVTQAGKTVVAKGLQDMIVVDTEDVLLLCPKHEEQEIKNMHL